ncbi:MAG: transporter substrate-binding protein [Actinomycetia bacterium]|nr:transporter substrate-binding protein [Actinomycetes bacterium]
MTDERHDDNVGLDRRTFMRRSAFGAAGVAMLAGGGMGAIATALESGSAWAAQGAKAKDLGTLDFQLSWVKNVEFAGEYIADTKGYYKKEGFSGVNLISGGPTVNQDSAVQAGKAFVGISAPDITASAINAGADLVIIGAQYQKNPFAVMSLAKSPIKTPQDMKGKKIGVQATNEAVWQSFLKANNIDPSSINKTVVQFDPTPLTTGQVDGWFSFVTNEPNVLKVKGFKTHTFLLADYKYPLVSETYMVKRSALTSERDKLKALLRADIKGWHDNYKNPSLGATLSVKKYGKSLGNTVKEQLLESKSENKLIFTPDTLANGLFTISDALIAENISTLGIAGIDITAAKLFDMSVLEEVYSENPALKTSPKAP